MTEPEPAGIFEGRPIYWLTEEQLERARADWPPGVPKPRAAWRTQDWTTVVYSPRAREERK